MQSWKRYPPTLTMLYAKMIGTYIYCMVPVGISLLWVQYMYGGINWSGLPIALGIMHVATAIVWVVLIVEHCDILYKYKQNKQKQERMNVIS